MGSPLTFGITPKSTGKSSGSGHPGKWQGKGNKKQHESTDNRRRGVSGKSHRQTAHQPWGQGTQLLRGDYPELRNLGIDVQRGDLADSKAVISAAAGCDTVFHVAAKPGIWGPYKSYYATNVTGTENIIDACRKNRVSKLVYTSSPSVVFAGGDMESANESAPYPKTYLAHYPRTKAMAERRVLSANDGDLSTVSLRPHLIWGPGDPNFLPPIH